MNGLFYRWMMVFGRESWMDRLVSFRHWWWSSYMMRGRRRNRKRRWEWTVCFLNDPIKHNFSSWRFKYHITLKTWSHLSSEIHPAHLSVYCFSLWLWYYRIYVFSSLFPPQPCLLTLLPSQSSPLPAVVQHSVPLLLAAWRTNSRSFHQSSQTTQEVNGVKLYSSLLHWIS